MAWPRVIAQLVIIGSQVFGRAFLQAWKQASVNATKQGVAPNKGVFSRGSSMPLEEARKILAIDAVQKPSYDFILEKHKHLFEANDTAKGGSFYLQSKVVRAKERVDEAIQNNEFDVDGYPPPPTSPFDSSSSSSSSSSSETPKE